MRLRPSYSSVTSTLALFVALSGGAYAAAKLPANSVGSRQIKNNAVVKAKIRSNSIDSSKVAPDALTGADIKECSLAKVPAAALADSATNATHANAAAAIDKLTYKSAIVRTAADGIRRRHARGCDAGQHVTGGGVQAATLDRRRASTDTRRRRHGVDGACVDDCARQATRHLHRLRDLHDRGDDRLNSQGRAGRVPARPLARLRSRGCRWPARPTEPPRTP